jgi:CheY-like chemotaxis protein
MQVVLDPDVTNSAGGTVLDRLRQLEQRGRPSPLWIVISALDRRDVVRQYGPSTPHFLAKPFDPWDLIRLKEILVG